MGRPKQTHCLNGHPFEPWNTKVYRIFSKAMQKYYDVRACKTCIRDRTKARYRSRKGQANA